jgi:hypothetical protein
MPARAASDRATERDTDDDTASTCGSAPGRTSGWSCGPDGSGRATGSRRSCGRTCPPRCAPATRWRSARRWSCCWPGASCRWSGCVPVASPASSCHESGRVRVPRALRPRQDAVRPRPARPDARAGRRPGRRADPAVRCPRRLLPHAGPLARDLDGGRPPYEHLLFPPLGGAEATALCDDLERELGIGVGVAIVDLNDFGGTVRATSRSALPAAELQEALRDNPMGQRRKGTPVAVVRRIA